MKQIWLNSTQRWWTDDRHSRGQMHRKIMLLLHTFTMRGSDVASLTEFYPVVYEEIEWHTNERMTDAWTDRCMENNVALAHPYQEAKWCSKFGRIPSSGLGGDSAMDRFFWWMEAFTISTSLLLKKSVGINIDLSLEILRDLKITTLANFWGNSTENPGDMFLCNNKIYLLNTSYLDLWDNTRGTRWPCITHQVPDKWPQGWGHLNTSSEMSSQLSDGHLGFPKWNDFGYFWSTSPYIIDFQTGGRGTHLEFPIIMILAILQQVNWPFGSGEEVENTFSRWWPSWITDRNNFSCFWSTLLWYFLSSF